jgi:hypothetical protein
LGIATGRKRRGEPRRCGAARRRFFLREQSGTWRGVAAVLEQRRAAAGLLSARIKPPAEKAARRAPPPSLRDQVGGDCRWSEVGKMREAGGDRSLHRNQRRPPPGRSSVAFCARIKSVALRVAPLGGGMREQGWFGCGRNCPAAVVAAAASVVPLCARIKWRRRGKPRRETLMKAGMVRLSRGANQAAAAVAPVREQVDRGHGVIFGRRHQGAGRSCCSPESNGRGVGGARITSDAAPGSLRKSSGRATSGSLSAQIKLVAETCRQGNQVHSPLPVGPIVGVAVSERTKSGRRGRGRTGGVVDHAGVGATAVVAHGHCPTWRAEQTEAEMPDLVESSEGREKDVLNRVENANPSGVSERVGVGIGS